MPSVNFFEEQGPTKEELLIIIKAMAWKYGLEKASSAQLPSKVRLFLTERDLDNARRRLEVSIANTQDPWGVAVEVIDYDNTVDEQLRKAFGDTVPAPETLKRAYKRVYGVDL